MKSTIVFLKNKEDASSFYRLYQYVKCLDCRIVDGTSSRIYRWYYDDNTQRWRTVKRLVMAVENLMRVTIMLLWDKIIWRSEKVIINRRLFPRKLPFYGTLLLNWYFKGKEVYWDFDDNIILDGEITEEEVKILQRVSKKIVVTNEFLRDTIGESYRQKVVLLPTTDAALESYDEESITAQRLESMKKEIRLFWLGTRNNLIYLDAIVPQLETCARVMKAAGKNIRLTVICNQKLTVQTKDLIIENIAWSRERGLVELKKAHIGLMPLQDTEYTKGKGGFKAIQYIGMGLPSIVSAVGFNSQVIENGYNGFLCKKQTDWSQYVLDLAKDEQQWKQFSMNARQKWEKMFNADMQRQFWESIVGR